MQACVIRPAEERALLDDVVGRVEAGGASFSVEGGRGAIRVAKPGELEIWSQAPVLRLHVDAGTEAVDTWSITFANALTDAVLTFADGTTTAIEADSRPDDPVTVRRFTVDLPNGKSSLHLSPPDATSLAPLTFAVMSDVQEAIGEVHDMYRRMNVDADLRFVVSTGDLTRQGTWDELVEFQQKMEGLAIPLYSTVGNHELGAPAANWHRLFGPFNFFFDFRGVRFTLIDSANATVEAIVYERMQPWLTGAAGRLHVFLTHEPIVDPVGERNGGFRSRKEAAKLVAMLAENGVDLLFFGHVHSFYAYSLGNVPTYISGGGGAIPERLDGIGRHYLKVTADPVRQTADVGLVRVD